MDRQTVFILGAGCSAASGCPLSMGFMDRAFLLARTTAPPAEITDALALLTRVRINLQRAFIKSWLDFDNLESFFSAIEMGIVIGRLGDLDGSTLKRARVAMTQVIAWTLSESQVYSWRSHVDDYHFSVDSSYVELGMTIKKLSHNGHRVSVLSFNYDYGAEFGLLRAGYRVDYCGPEQTPVPPLYTSLDTIEVFKLHGSLNWYKRSSPDGARICAVPVEPIGPVDLEVRCARVFMEHARREAGDAEFPFLVPPTDAKAAYRGEMSAVWQKAAQALVSARAYPRTSRSRSSEQLK